jgi:hypothetical protein
MLHKTGALHLMIGVWAGLLKCYEVVAARTMAQASKIMESD